MAIGKSRTKNYHHF